MCGERLTGQHVHVGAVWDAENVGRDFVTSLADVHLDDTLGVDRETLVRVDSHAEETGVGLLLLCYPPEGSRNQNNKLISMCPHVVVLSSIQTTTATMKKKQNNHNTFYHGHTQQNKKSNQIDMIAEKDRKKQTKSNWAFFSGE